MIAMLFLVVMATTPPSPSLVVLPPASGTTCHPSHRLMRELRVGPQTTPTSNSVVVSFVSDGEDWVLSLTRGVTELVRRRLRGSCDDAGLAAVVIIERLLRDIEMNGANFSPRSAAPSPLVKKAVAKEKRLSPPAQVVQTANESSLADAGIEEVEVTLEVAVDAGSPITEIPLPAVQTSPTPTPTSWLARVEVLAGGGVWPGPLRGVGAIEVALWKAQWRASVFGAMGSVERIVITDGINIRGQAELVPAIAALTASRCYSPSTFDLCGGLLAGTRFSAGQASGEFLFQRAPQFLVRPTVGLTARGAWRMSPMLLISLDIGGLFNLSADGFEVEGLARIPLPTFEFLARVSLGWFTAL